MEAIDEYTSAALRELTQGDRRVGALAPELRDQVRALFDAQLQSRHLDLAARSLQGQGRGFYTIGSAGHESNAALGLLARTDDPALLHYRSGGFYAARAAVAGHKDAVRDVLRGVTASVADPISGGRHKVFGHPDLHVIPQTSTIASHLPRAVGLALSLDLAARVDQETPWARDAVVICSFGDASANHSTATGALNASAYLRHRRIGCPVLFVCEDNGIGISTRSPRGWPGAMLENLAGIRYWNADGADPLALLTTTADALRTVRETRAPGVLHLRTVRFMGHAGSDAEIAYRSRTEIAADYARDPILATARVLVDGGVLSGAEAAEEYERVRDSVLREAEVVGQEPNLASASAVVAPLDLPTAGPTRTAPPSTPRSGPALTLAQSINSCLDELMSRHHGTLVFGQDVAVKGGVYGVTRGLRRKHGGLRVFDTLLDEQTILGIALGSALAGFVPVPEIQYLAYLHNAEDQLRGEGASLRFFSSGQYQNGMVVRVAGLAYQKGFGGHFHNDNSVAVLTDVPGLVLAVPSHPADAPGMLRTCHRLAREDGRVCVFLEPIALYHARDLHEGDGAWTAPYVGPDGPAAELALGAVGVTGTGRDLLLITFGNGVPMSLRAAARLDSEGVATTVLDLRWLAPLPVAAVAEHARNANGVLVVDETRRSGGVAESVISALVDDGYRGPIARVTSADSFIPLGPAARTVLLDEDDVLRAARTLTQQTPRRPDARPDSH